MNKRDSSRQHKTVLVGWQGITAEIPEDWNISAISGDDKAGYVRFDDDDMPRLEIKWASESGFVDLDAVITKYLAELQKGRARGLPQMQLETDTRLISKRKRKKSGLKCFHWKAEAEGYGAAWLCKDCGRTMIAQVMIGPGEGPESAKELASSVLLSIEDHSTGGWILWSAYGFGCYVPEEFHISGQKLMAGLIQFEFENETEKISLSRWGMANVALKKRSLQDWIASEMAKTFRKHAAEPEPVRIKGHEGLNICGGVIAGVQKLQRFYLHCAGKLFADELIARAWHCEPTNRLYYIETFVDRQNAGLVDQLVERIQCHPGATAEHDASASHD